MQSPPGSSALHRKKRLSQQDGESHLPEWNPFQTILRYFLCEIPRQSAIKQVAIGRKNWLFVGSVVAGERAANFLTLVSSALRNDLAPYDYVKAVLDALLTGTRDFAPLRPDTWAQSHPQSIRTYRQRERTARVTRTTTRRRSR